MIYLGYILAAAAVVFLSIKASHYVDLLDKRTMLSGAFIGGVMLSAVTSFPELFTSISAVVILEKPVFGMGNVLGSDLFNLTVLAVVILLNFRLFVRSYISKSYRNIVVFILLIYILIGLNFFDIVNAQILNLSCTSVLILLLYLLGAKYMAVAEDFRADEAALHYHAGIKTKLSVKQIAFRFAFSAAGIIFFSVVVSYLTEMLAFRLNLTQGLAGALLLGVATSLPELSFTVTLFRMKNYNIAVGNIVGSNLFNFIILAVSDIFSTDNIYVTDQKILHLLFTGAAASLLFWLLLRCGSRRVKMACAAGIVICYGIFVIL